MSGVSVIVCDPSPLSQRGDRGKLFQKVLIDHYPWNEERHITDAQINTDAAKALYRIFRNPLSHTLGLVDPEDNPSGQHVVIEKGPNTEDFIEKLEAASTRPPEWTEPTLRARQNELVLWVAALYWGVRQMIYNAVSISALQATSSASQATSSVSQATSNSIPQPPGLTSRST